MKLKVFGERNTGTNALSQMLKQNSKSSHYPGTMGELSPSTTWKIARAKDLGLTRAKKEALIDAVFDGRHLLEQWKHSATSFPCEGCEKVHFIFTVRDPRSWLIGLYKNPYHLLVYKPKGLIEFSELDWKVVRRDNLPNSHYKPLELYAEKLNSYLRFINILEKSNISYTVIKFEEFVINQKKAFECTKIYLDAPSDSFMELKESTKDKEKDSNYYASYYLDEAWREEFPEIDTVPIPVSNDVMSFFKY